jgi:hypothetical protein
MRQLVGSTCVNCQKRIGSVLEGRFCGVCQRPVHNGCIQAQGGTRAEGRCAACGAVLAPAAAERTDLLARKGSPAAGTDAWVVRLAGPERFRNPLKTCPWDDTGPLEWEAGQVRIWARNAPVVLTGVTGLSLARQTPPWLMIGLGNLLILGMIFGGLTTTLTPSNPATWVVLVAANALQFLVGGPRKWIRIDYATPSGVTGTKYMTDAAWFGWRSVFGGTDRLYGVLREPVLSPRTAPGASKLDPAP